MNLKKFKLYRGRVNANRVMGKKPLVIRHKCTSTQEAEKLV